VTHLGTRPPRRELVTLLVYLDAGSHKAAAHRPGISESTCRQRVSQLIRRVGARNAAQAIWRLGNAALDEHRRRSRVGPDATDLMAASMPFPGPADSTEIRMAVNDLPTVFEIGKEREFGRGERSQNIDFVLIA